MRRAVLALALLSGCLFAAPRPAHAQDLGALLDRIASTWHRGDASSLMSLAARGGISVDIDGRSVGPLGQRQAAAVLRRVFEDRESVNARTSMSRVIGGDPARAFGAINWTTRARGTTIPEHSTLFVAFVLEDGRWRITEIRLMR
jgi:hypothetical protein